VSRMGKSHRWAALVAVVGASASLLLGCSGDDDGGSDSGVPDSGSDAMVIEDAGVDANVPDAGPQCMGHARPCESFGNLACNVPGCDLTPEMVCFTMGSSCYTHSLPAECDATPGCYYNLFQGCEAAYLLCTVPAGESCYDQPGCAIGPMCTGTATSCGDMDLAECEDNPGCFVYPP